jgi:hypothetical protein
MIGISNWICSEIKFVLMLVYNVDLSGHKPVSIEGIKEEHQMVYGLKNENQMLGNASKNWKNLFRRCKKR